MGQPVGRKAANVPVVSTCYRIRGAAEDSILVEPGEDHTAVSISGIPVRLDLEGVVALREALQTVSGLVQKTGIDPR
jgi:hypothetical protein